MLDSPAGKGLPVRIPAGVVLELFACSACAGKLCDFTLGIVHARVEGHFFAEWAAKRLRFSKVVIFESNGRCRRFGLATSFALGNLIWVLSCKQCDYWLEGRLGREREFKNRPVDLLFDQVSEIEFVRCPSEIKNDQFSGVVTNL